MKRQIAFLFALTFMVSGMATMAEETAQENAAAQTEIVETAETEWVAPFEDGEWLSVPEWNAEVYLPAGWVLTEVTENGFIAADAEEASTMVVTIEDFLSAETVWFEEMPEAAADETEAAAEETETDAAADETDAAAETDEGAELSDFEAYLMGLGEEYELALMGEREAAVFAAEDSVTVRFPVKEHLVTMTFAPAVEGSLAESALSVAETFHIYEEAEEAELTVDETVEAAETSEE